MSKKVLMIAYQFPPMGGSGVQRTSKFVKHLQKFGYEPIVLTRKTDNVSLIDTTLEKEIPSNIKIYRTTSFDLSDSTSKKAIPSKILARKVLIPDQARIWELSLHNKVLKIIKEHNINIIYSTSYPYSDHLLALSIKKKLGEKIKWVCDFRDEWSNNPYTKDNPHSKYRTNKELKMESEVLKCADKVIANTPVMRQNFIDIHKINTDREKDFYTIANGYDVDDFRDLDTSPISTEQFTITYTGALYGRRKPDYFFEAVGNLVKDNAIDIDKLKINFIGNYKKEQLIENVTKFGIEKCVHIYDYMPHKQALENLAKSNAVLLLEGGGIGSDAFYTGKVFEYMYINRPVIAVLPNGCAKDIVVDSKIGLVSHFEDVEKTKQNILTLYNMWQEGIFYDERNLEVISRFERKELTKQLSQVFDSLF